jgi:hypothetical protein
MSNADILCSAIFANACSKSLSRLAVKMLTCAPIERAPACTSFWSVEDRWIIRIDEHGDGGGVGNQEAQ